LAFAEKRGKTWRARWPLPGLSPEGKVRFDSKSGFPTKTAAKRYGEAQEAAVRERRWIDPAAGQITLDDYLAKWFPVQELALRTREKYEGYQRNHLTPRWGNTALADIDPLDVDEFEKSLKAKLADSTVDGIMGLLRMALADAVFDKRISASPVRPSRRRRGKREQSEARVGIAVQLEVVEQVRRRLPASEALMILIAAFTGMRWGELIGMRRRYLVLMPDAPGAPAGYVTIDRKDGAVHEDKRGGRYLGAPKGGKGRTVELPPFLVMLLAAYLESLPVAQEFLFPDREGGHWRRSNFNRRLWRPACDGWAARRTARGHAAREAAAPVVRGLRVHDMRHTQETWLMEDGVEKIARDERLGHKTPGMEGTYGHATAAMRADILKVLQSRWERYWALVE
jgi:integrase